MTFINAFGQKCSFMVSGHWSGSSFFHKQKKPCQRKPVKVFYSAVFSMNDLHREHNHAQIYSFIFLLQNETFHTIHFSPSREKMSVGLIFFYMNFEAVFSDIL
jgi:hypothetical protein